MSRRGSHWRGLRRWPGKKGIEGFNKKYFRNNQDILSILRETRERRAGQRGGPQNQLYCNFVNLPASTTSYVPAGTSHNYINPPAPPNAAAMAAAPAATQGPAPTFHCPECPVSDLPHPPCQPSSPYRFALIAWPDAIFTSVQVVTRCVGAVGPGCRWEELLLILMLLLLPHPALYSCPRSVPADVAILFFPTETLDLRQC